MTVYAHQWDVLSSDGKRTYVVSVTADGQWQCGCMGWTGHMPRKDCKHIKGKKGKKAESGVGSVRAPARAVAPTPAPTVQSALRSGATPEQATDAARAKRDEVQAKKDAQLSKLRHGFQLAEEWLVGDGLPHSMVAEVKYDGHLAMLVDGCIINRSGRDITHRFPEVSKVNGSAVLVGELIIPYENGNGLGDFSGGIQARNTDDEVKIRALAKQRPALFVAFDILEAAGEDVTALPLRQRRMLLETFYQHAQADRHSLIQQEPIQSKQDVLRLRERERARGGEGIMVKDLDATYTAKRGRNWLKVKTWQDRKFRVLQHEYTGIGDGFVITIKNKGREQTVNMGDRKMREVVKANKSVTVEVKFLSEADDGALRFPSVRRVVPA